MSMKNILNSIQEKQVIMPYLENAFHNDQWPEQYEIRVDSEPYYGLTDEEGITHDVGVGDGYFHPSSHPLMSARELYYRWHPKYSSWVKQERRSLTSHMTLAGGSAMHAVIQTQLHMAKILRRAEMEDTEWVTTEHNPQVDGRWVPDNPFEWEYINREHLVRGRMDGVADIPGRGEVGFEFKTMNSRSFRFLDAAKPEWQCQLQLGLDNFGLAEGVVLVMEMGYPFSFKEFSVTRRRDKVQEIYDKFDYVRECVENNTPPRCEHSFQSPQSKNCPVGHICWSPDD